MINHACEEHRDHPELCMAPQDGGVEQWWSVAEFPGYFYSSAGRVLSVERASLRGRPGRILRQQTNDHGYREVTLYRDGIPHTRRVHRLVLEAFVGPAPEGMECCHDNGNPGDNRTENLRWDTHSENMFDAVNHGTHNRTSRTHCPQGHELLGANLRPSEARRGNRSCLACDRAGKYAKRNGLDFLATSHNYYRQIMGEGAPGISNT